MPRQRQLPDTTELNSRAPLVLVAFAAVDVALQYICSTPGHEFTQTEIRVESESKLLHLVTTSSFGWPVITVALQFISRQQWGSRCVAVEVPMPTSQYFFTLF